MKNKAIMALPVSGELQRQIRLASKETRLSQADVMRQSISIGLPRLRDALSGAKNMATAPATVPAAK